MIVVPLKTLAGLNNSVYSLKRKARLDNQKRFLKSNINKNRPLVCSSRRSAKPKPKIPIGRTTCSIKTLYEKTNSTLIIHSER